NGIFNPLNDGRNVIYDPVNDDVENEIYDPENNHENGIYNPGENKIYISTGTSGDLHSVFYTDDDLQEEAANHLLRNNRFDMVLHILSWRLFATAGAAKAITIEIKKKEEDEIAGIKK
ncbi:6909_t:CDS:2, partial [Funneliformis geosporum]